jgi:hypothetical protein
MPRDLAKSVKKKTGKEKTGKMGGMGFEPMNH